MKKNITLKQKIILDELFNGVDEQTAAAKHKITMQTYRRWLGQSEFISELQYRIESAHRQSRILLARYRPLAAAKLIELMNNGEGETLRKACLDILSLPEKTNREQNNSNDNAVMKISNKKASQILRILAQD